MSVRLWNGLILRNHSLEQAYDILKQVRQACLPLMQSALVARTAEVFVFEAELPLNFHEFKRPALALDDVPDLIFDAKCAVLPDNGRHSDDWDFSFKVSLFPKGPDVLALHHKWNNPGYVEALTQAGFDDYHYQDQTDCSASVTDEEWRQRRLDWESTRYGAHGLTFEVIEWSDVETYSYAITLRMLFGALPSEARRRERIARHLARCEARKVSPADPDSDYVDYWAFTRSLEAHRPAVKLHDNILSLPFLHANDQTPPGSGAGSQRTDTGWPFLL